jgi:SAM-dependent methyltransferase
MFKKEAAWISSNLQRIDFQEGISCLNLGSSTRTYREIEQPFINELIIKWIEQRGRITHVDAKNDDGVDIVGDFSDPTFLNDLSRRQFNLILCNNIMMFLENPGLVYKLIDRCLVPGGYLVISCARVYPYCADPVDSKYRPHLNDIVGELPDYKVIANDAVIIEETHFSRLIDDSRSFGVFILNVLVPRKGLRIWFRNLSDLPNLFKRLETTCVVMRKPEK